MNLKLAVSLLLLCSLSYAGETVFSARQLGSSYGAVSVYYTHTSETLSLQVNSNDAIAVGNVQYFSAVTNDLATDVKSDRVAVKWSFHPTPEIDYWLKAGSANYELSYPAASERDTLSSDEPGYVVGFGFRKLLMPDTIVTPAVSVDLGGEYLECGLQRFQQGNAAATVVSDRVVQTEVQASVIASKKYKVFEPYAGLKVSDEGLSLLNKASVNSVSGTKNLVSLFAGCKVAMAGKDGLIIEASFIGQTAFTAGWNIEF
jgi:hypothetical protein